MSTFNCLVTNIHQNNVWCVQHKKEIHTDLQQLKAEKLMTTLLCWGYPFKLFQTKYSKSTKYLCFKLLAVLTGSPPLYIATTFPWFFSDIQWLLSKDFHKHFKKIKTSNSSLEWKNITQVLLRYYRFLWLCSIQPLETGFKMCDCGNPVFRVWMNAFFGIYL